LTLSRPVGGLEFPGAEVRRHNGEVAALGVKAQAITDVQPAVRSALHAA
jgi:hypothetical protein